MGLEVALFAVTAASAVSGYMQQQKAAKAQKRANAAAMAAATEEAGLAKKDAAFAADQERKEAARVRGQQIAAYLKSGVTLDGSPLLTAQETTDKGEQNAQNTIDNAESRAKSIMLRGQAAQQPVTSPDLFGTAATVLTAGKSAFPQTFKSVGAY